MTSPDLEIAEPEACPYLGLPDDPRSRFMFAASAHRCHVKAKPVPIELGHQGSYCLSTRYPACERFPLPGGAGRREPDSPAATAPTTAVATTAVATAPVASDGAHARQSRDAEAGRSRALRRPAALLAALALVALVVAIGVRAIGGPPAAGGAPGGVASPSAAATAAPTPALSATPAAKPAPSPTPAPTPTPSPSPSPTASPAPTGTPAPTAIVHVVTRGETLWSIAAFYGVTVPAILGVNVIADPNVIVVGQKIVIPARP